MKLVYIAHPLGKAPDRVANIVKATAWCAWAAGQGVVPLALWIAIATHWDESRRDQGLAIDFATIDVCDEVWLCGERISEGMMLEAKHARGVMNRNVAVWRVPTMGEVVMRLPVEILNG